MHLKLRFSTDFTTCVSKNACNYGMDKMKLQGTKYIFKYVGYICTYILIDENLRNIHFDIDSTVHPYLKYVE